MSTQELSKDGKRLVRRIARTKRPVVFLFGSALTAPEASGSRGVANVRTIATKIGDMLGEDAGAAFSEAFKRGQDDKTFGFAEAYRLGFEVLIDEYDQDHANTLIREAVLGAYVPLSDDEKARVLASDASHSKACGALLSDERIGGWHLRDSVVALGQVLRSDPSKFPRVLTTNFDPLIEVAIKRAEGSRMRTVLDRDGNPGRSEGDGTQVVYVHGYWYGADTLHVPQQLEQDRPQLRSTLREWVKKSKIVVLGYSGWNDVLTTVLAECAADENVQPDIEWAFYEDVDSQVMGRLKKAADVKRANAFEHVDMHLFLPALRNALEIDAAQAGFGEAEQKRRVQWLEPPYETLEPSAQLAGARLLMPRYGVVPFTGRDELLDDFGAWCEGGGLQIRLVTGQGGQGKSRLLRELCKRRVEAGWVAGVVRKPMNLDAIQAEASSGLACLLAVDYAETCGDALVALLTSLHRIAKADGPPIRVVLAARAEADWWELLRTKASEVVALDAMGVVMPLPPPVGEPADDWQETVARFQRARGREVEPVLVPTTEHMKAWLDQGVLTLHVAALLASEGMLPTGEDGRAGLFDVLLKREEVCFWEPKGQELASGVDDRFAALAQVAALATLIGPVTDKAAAREWLKRLPALQGLTATQLGGLAKVFAQLYPLPQGEERRALPPIQPDRIGEHLVAREVGEESALALLPFEFGSGEEAAQALRVLGRAASWHEGSAAALLLKGAAAYPVAFTRAWVEVASEETWTPAVARVVEKALGALNGFPPDEADELRESIPLESVALRGVAYLLAKQATGGWGADEPDQATRSDRARRLDNLGSHASLVGKREDALKATLRAVELREVLAQARPDAFLPNLAASLNNLGIRYSELGKREDALKPSLRAVEHYEVLAQARPDAFLPNLAASLNNLGIRYSELGKREDALKPSLRAVEHYEVLAQARPDAFLPDLAMSLNNLGIRYSELGKREDALKPTLRAVEHYEVLAQARPDAFLPDLAGSLNNLGAMYSELGKREDALKATLRAVEHYEVLAQARPDAFLPNLAASLNNLGAMYSELGKREDALKATLRAVEHYEVLAQARPDAFLPNLAASLNNLGIRYSELGKREDALKPSLRAVEHYEVLAQARPDAFLPDLAMSLNNLGAMYSELGKREDALKATLRAVEHYEVLAQARPDAFLPDLAGSLNNLGVRYSKLGKREDALKATLRAVEHYEVLAQARPDAFLPDLAGSLNNLGVRYSKLGKREDALKATLRAVEHYEVLAQARPDAFLPDLAMSLNNLGIRYSELGKREDALKATLRAVEHYEVLATQLPEVFRPMLVRSLMLYARLLIDAGNTEERTAVLERLRALGALENDD